MNLHFRPCDSLPPLAWCARLDHGSHTAVVTHGPGVETAPSFFVEGAWDGPYSDAAFHQAAAFMGSGGKLVGANLVLATPSHTLERLHLLRHADSLFVSNSLPFVLAAAGLQLVPTYPFYKNHLWSITYGLQRCVRRLPTRGGPPVHLYYFSNIEITPDLQLQERPKSAPDPWTDFAAYRRFLIDTLSALARNAAAPQRHTRYEFLASLSSGYDSPAAAALAAEAGCRRAVTFRTGVHIPNAAPVDDSGAPIARLLGIDVREFARHDHRAAADAVAAEFAAAGDSFDAQLSAFEPLLPQTIFVTGFNGDSIWDRLQKRPSPYFVRHDPPSGTSLGEFRLRVGFLHCPVPFIGAVRHPAIHAVTTSPEMAPWTLRTDYDRPIPRRILEEKAIPRNLFARGKTASFTAVQSLRRPENCGPAFEDFYATYCDQLSPLRRASAELVYLLRRARSRLTTLSDRLGLPHVVPPISFCDIPVPGRPSLIVPWGVSTLQARYLDTLQDLQ